MEGKTRGRGEKRMGWKGEEEGKGGVEGVKRLGRQVKLRGKGLQPERHLHNTQEVFLWQLRKRRLPAQRLQQKCGKTRPYDARLVLDVRRWPNHTLRIHAASSSLFSHFSSAASCTRRRRACYCASPAGGESESAFVPHRLPRPRAAQLSLGAPQASPCGRPACARNPLSSQVDLT